MPRQLVIFANGRSFQIQEQTSISAFLKDRSVNHASVLVELNGHALLKSEYDTTLIAHGDRLEVVKVVAGG
ncbi:MAG: sulfur carrier protein ThiS [Verrucomicrobiota bacterium]|nr:sulfur carrier protein ThiS [Verrucomicrobiota bacterium]